VKRVVAELARIGFSDIRQVVDWGPGSVTVRDSASIGDDAAAAVAEVGKTATGIKVKLYDKVGALEKLGRHLGMFKDKVEVAGAGGGPIKADLPPNELMRRLAFLLTTPKDDGSC
jgi:phage terminase small subunit